MGYVSLQEGTLLIFIHEFIMHNSLIIQQTTVPQTGV